jgi:hypothetical protein
MASCVFGAGANELAEASIVASTKVRMTAAATMLVTATGQQDSDGDRVAANSDQTPGTYQPTTHNRGGEPAGKGGSTEAYCLWFVGGLGSDCSSLC